MWGQLNTSCAHSSAVEASVNNSTSGAISNHIRRQPSDSSVEADVKAHQSDWQEDSRSQEAVEQFLRETKVRLAYLRRVELTNRIETFGRDFQLTQEQESRLYSVAKAKGTVDGSERELILSEYYQFVTVDETVQLQRRHHEAIENELLDSIEGELRSPGMLEFMSNRVARLQDAWSLKMAGQIQLTIDISDKQRSELFKVVTGFAGSRWEDITTPLIDTDDSQVNNHLVFLLNSLSDVLSPSQMFLLRSRWAINGLIPVEFIPKITD